MNNLYKDGHNIVYYTARGMARNNGDPVQAEREMWQLTKDQLKSWGCLYHDLKFGKPSADMYIDDKAMWSEDFF